MRRGELLDVAFDLMQEVGYDAMSVETVTSRAKVAKGTFYHYFASKDELLYELLQRFGQGLTDHLSQAVSGRSGTARERLQALIDAATEYKTAHTGQSRSVTFLYRKDNQTLRFRLYAVWADATRNVLRPIIAQGVADGSFAVADVDFAADALISLWYEAADRLWLRAIAEPDADSFVRVLLAGGAGLKQAQERVLGLPGGAIDLAIDQRLVDAVKPLYQLTREIS